MSINNKVLFTLSMILSSIVISASPIDKSFVFSPSRLGEIQLHHDDNGFMVATHEDEFRVQPCYMDKELRGISEENLKKMVALGLTLSVNKMEDCNEYSLRLKGGLKGGGVGGATGGFYLGKFLTHFVCHSAILIAAACTGPAAPATLASLELTFGPLIEGASNVVALGCGVTGGVLTGPV